MLKLKEQFKNVIVSILTKAGQVNYDFSKIQESEYQRINDTVDSKFFIKIDEANQNVELFDLKVPEGDTNKKKSAIVKVKKNKNK